MKMRFLDPLFREYGVDAVFTSHDHIYERCETYVDNYRLLYFVEGVGGAPLYSRASGWDVPGSWMWDELNQTYYTKAFDNSSHIYLVTAFEIIGHIWNKDNVLEESFRVLRPQGVFILTTPNMLSFLSRILVVFGYLPTHFNPSLKYQVEKRPFQRKSDLYGHFPCILQGL